jgi:L-amino acid N-acyltransferase YncA
MNLKIRLMGHKDWDQVKAIYAEGIESGNATFETAVPDWEGWNERHLEKCRLVAVHDKIILGWAALSPISARHAYSGVAEVSIYVKSSARNQGVGNALLKKLILESEKAGIWTLQAGIFPENLESIKLHKANGFREVGIRERIGKMHDQWRDVVLLERRSMIAGS